MSEKSALRSKHRLTALRDQQDYYFLDRKKKMHSTCFLLLISLLCAVQAQDGANVFDPQAEMCCDGSVYPLSGSDGCCHGQPFNSSTHVCCSADNRVPLVALPAADVREKERRSAELSATTYECCGSQAIDPAQQVCCLGHASKRMYANSACCGSKVYDAERFVCCGGNALFRRRGNPSTKGEISQCCGTQGFDPKRHLCCQGKLYTQWSISTSACCGTKPYDIGFQICCQGQVHNDPFGIQGCCGDQLYDVFLGLCCGKSIFVDTMRVKSCCGENAYDPANQTCCGEKVTDEKINLNANESCCLAPSLENARDDVGEEEQRPLDQSRIEDDVSEKEEQRPLDQSQKAESAIYDRHDHVCCDGRVNEGRPESSECCGGQAYDKDGEWECCGGRTLTRKLNKRQEEDDEARCCRGNVVRVPKDKQLCC